MSKERKARASAVAAPPPEPVASPPSIVDRIAFGPVAAVRPWLFAKALYVLLALDVWHTLVGPAWRYGAAGFNVSHFAILDALPIPTREVYVGMLVVVGAMAFVAALVPSPPRALSIAITVLYTWGWSCSMLDSYQHHYLITTLLFAACFFPRHTAVDVLGLATPPPRKKAARAPGAPSPRLVRSLGWTMTTLFAGIVYAFTAVSKMEPEWRSGAALRSITGDGATMRGAVDLAGAFGIGPDTLFPLLGSGMIVVQVVCALGYLTASVRDDAAPSTRRALGALATSALVLALSFHVGAEYIGLQIGWFSYYMIALALVALTPATWLAAVASLVTAPVRTETSVLETASLLAPGLGLVAAVTAAWAGTQIDLPGAYEAGVLVGLASLAIAGVATVRANRRSELGRAALAIGLGMLVCCWSMTTGNERYDFYRFSGGDFRRRHEYQRALEDYRQANRYAPPGQSREDRIREMEEAIRREGL